VRQYGGLPEETEGTWNAGGGLIHDRELAHGGIKKRGKRYVKTDQMKRGLTPKYGIVDRGARGNAN